MQDDLVVNQAEALKYAKQCPSRELGEALDFAIGFAVMTIINDEKEYYLKHCFPEKKLDMLLYVRLLSHLLQHRERLDRILDGDFSDNWLPPELEESVRKR